MHSALSTIQGNLKNLILQIQTAVPNNEPIGLAHGSWNLPQISKTEFIEEAESIIDLIERKGADKIDDDTANRVLDYGRRLDFLRANTVGQIWSGNGGLAATAYFLTLDGLRKALRGALTRDEAEDATRELRSLTLRVRGLTATLNSVEPRTGAISDMVDRIESAYSAADQLPADLAALSEARQKVSEILNIALQDREQLNSIKADLSASDAALKEAVAESKRVLERCETAYSAATSVGLAAAFTERSTSLSKSMWIWVAGLTISLIAGSIFGSIQLHNLSELFKQPNITMSMVILNTMLSMLSVGAPIWFGWLATKQIGQRFRLAEDYAFKAAVSRAYEGFRRETARFDKDMQSRLLATAMNRLDELPLRLVESETHGSPWHEFASSELIKNAIRIVPGFTDQIKQMAIKATDGIGITRQQQKASDTTP